MIWKNIAFAALGLLATGTASAATSGSPAALVAALAEKPPQVLSELEAVVGPLHRDPTKWDEAIGPLHRVSPGPGVARVDVELAIDMHHEQPQEVADPSLQHWDLDFLSGREACRRLLAARFPNPREIRADNRVFLRFGGFYFTALDTADGFRLSWYDLEPLFAVPLRDARETKKLVNALTAVAKAGFTRQAIVTHLGPLTHDPGWNADVRHTATWDLFYDPAGAVKPQRLTIGFKRPLPSRELLSKLGILKPRVRAGDVHAVSLCIFDRAKPLSSETGYPMPAVGGYAVNLCVDPHGLIATDEQEPGSPVWRAEGTQIIYFEALAPWRERRTPK